ncbi:MAG: DnaD domain protein [Clostridia bacterium]|nr:DnaD domain protein [Clostridia bacterium]
MLKDSRPGVILYLEDFNAVEDLTDAQLGQLLRALVEYEQTGQKKKIQGEVGMAYAFITQKFDIDRERYTQTKKARSKAAKARWDKAADREAVAQETESTQIHDDTMKKMQMHDLHSDAVQTMQYKDKDENENININENQHQNENKTGASACTEQVTGGDGGMTREFLNLMSRYCDLTGERYQLVRENFASLCKQYSEDWLSKAVECAVKSGNTSIAYIRGILRNWAQAGRPDEREFRDKPQYHDNPALNYSQRTNDLENLYMDL